MVEFKIHTIDKVVSPEEFQKNLKKKNKFPSIIDKKTKKEFPPTKEALDTSKKERTKLSNEKLANMTNREFLGISRARRLENITKNNIKSEKVADRTQKHLEFTFTFNGTFNKELYLKTTAGQVLPKEVASVECDGMTYKRNNLSGEFFAGGNKRLLIKEGTKIDITKFRSEDDIIKLQEANKAQYNKFKETKDYNAGLDDIVSEAIKRGIDPKFAILAFGDKVKDMPIMALKRPILVEEMFTQYDRMKGGISLTYNNADKGLQILILREFGGDKWEEKAKEYGISKEVIKEFKNKVSNGNGILEYYGRNSSKEQLSLRRLEGLKENFKGKVKMFLNEAWKKGIGIFVTEGYRSQKRQNELYAQGRTKSGKKVTWTLNSNHTKGIAIDIAFDSSLYGSAYPKDHKKWRQVANIAKKYGINWGYDLWKKDRPHFQDNGVPINIDKDIDAKIANRTVENSKRPKKSRHLARKLNLKTRTEIIANVPSNIKKSIKKYFPASEVENAILVAHGESGFKLNAYRDSSKNSGGGNDLGLFQINDKYHPEIKNYNWRNPDVNAKFAYKIYKEAGKSWKPWYAAKKIGLV